MTIGTNAPPTAGKNPTDEYLEGMMSEAPGPINFTMFLTMFGEKLNGTDPEDVIRNAFACFDEEASGQQPPVAWSGLGLSISAGCPRVCQATLGHRGPCPHRPEQKSPTCWFLVPEL